MYWGVGRAFAVTVTFTAGDGSPASTAYVPAVTYGCDLTKPGDCQILSKNLLLLKRRSKRFCQILSKNLLLLLLFPIFSVERSCTNQGIFRFPSDPSAISSGNQSYEIKTILEFKVLIKMEWSNSLFVKMEFQSENGGILLITNGKFFNGNGQLLIKT